MAEEKIIAFDNIEQVILYECEMKGQISDGNWENAVPMNHWKCMCEAKAVVAGVRYGIASIYGFKPKRKYNFANKDLYEIVKDRMIFWVKACTIYPHLSYDSPWDWDLSEGSERLRKFADGKKENNSYWTEKISNMEKLFGCTIEEAEEKIRKVLYSESDLKKDLKAMSEIVNGTRERHIQQKEENRKKIEYFKKAEEERKERENKIKEYLMASSKEYLVMIFIKEMGVELEDWARRRAII